MYRARVLTVSIDKGIFRFLENKCRETVCLEKFDIYIDKGILPEGDIHIMLMGCDYRCKLKRCLSKFVFFSQNRQIPFALVRSSYLREVYKSPKTLFFTVYEDYSLTSLQRKILSQIKIQIDHPLYSRKLIHPTDPIYKVLEVQRKIAENPQKRETLSSLASQVYLSPSWLSHQFKKISGISLDEFSLRIRFCYSLWKILSTRKLLKIIALDLGYKPLSFTKRFSSIFGVPPSEVRKNLSLLLT